MSNGNQNSRPPSTPPAPGGQPARNQVALAVELDPAVANGVYANLAMVNHNETEFILDFLFVQPQQPRATVRSRVISSPKHTKRLMLALQDNIAKYEQRFGEIDVSRPGPEDGLLQ
ncbi:MAG: DUF3467 domain-containing protein [Deltaproteobacteria bacterium]|nr:DUF3467 domain-containing protein [Deltaproteobacteria bacterium]